MSYSDAMFHHYQILTKTVDEYRKGRTIVLLGDSAVYRKYLAETYGITDCMVVTIVKEKAGNGLTHIEEIKGRNDRYYIVAPRLQKDLELQMRLYSYGYEDFEDCFFYNHGTIRLIRGTEKYSDPYGNHIHSPSCDVLIDQFATHLQIDVDSSCKFGKGGLITAKGFGGAKVTIGEKCVFENNVTLLVSGDAEVSIGSKCLFVRNSEMIVLGGTTLHIGKNCLFSFDIKIYCGDGHPIFDLKSRTRLNLQSKDNPKSIIHIGDHVWAGMRSIILNRTVIGTSSIIGAGSLVKGEFPNNCIVAGVPAKMIRKDITWSGDYLLDDINAIPEEYQYLTGEAPSEETDL